MNKVFIDANVLIYLFDHTSQLHTSAKKILNNAIKNKFSIYISHHILEEFIHVQLKLAHITQEKDMYNRLETDIKNIERIPKLFFVEPPETFSFLLQVIQIMQEHEILPNDAYILTLLLQKENMSLATFDKRLTKVAVKLDIPVLN